MSESEEIDVPLTISTQWIANVVSVKNEKNENIEISFGKIIGPPSDEQKNVANAAVQDESIYKVIIKIAEKFYIDSLVIYQTQNNQALSQIEVQESEDEWFCIWQNNQPYHINEKNLFQPIVRPTLFEADTLRLTINKDVNLIDAIEVKGYQYIIPINEFNIIDNEDEALNSLLSLNLCNLIDNNLFADVYFEIEGKRIAAHRNILSCRNNFFKNLIDKHESQQNPIFIPNINYNSFINIMTFLYTANFDATIDLQDCLDLLRIIDSFEMNHVEEILLYLISDLVNETNVIKLYRAAHDKLPCLDKVIEICYDRITPIFAQIIKTDDFRSLQENLLLKLLRDVVGRIQNKSSQTEVDDEDYYIVPGGGHNNEEVEDDEDDDTSNYDTD